MSFGHPISILDTLFYLPFTCKSIVSEQFGHPVFQLQQNWMPYFKILAKNPAGWGGVGEQAMTGSCSRLYSCHYEDVEMVRVCMCPVDV